VAEEIIGLAQKRTARHPAYHTKIRAAKVWAGNAYVHLGRKEPKMTTTVYLDRAIMRIFRRNKNGAPAECPQTLAHSFSHPVSAETESEVVGRPEVQRRPLARSPVCDVHPKVSASPSSRLTAVP
jgi:hypothetical protein